MTALDGYGLLALAALAFVWLVVPAVRRVRAQRERAREDAKMDALLRWIASAIRTQERLKGRVLIVPERRFTRLTVPHRN